MNLAGFVARVRDDSEFADAVPEASSATAQPVAGTVSAENVGGE